MKEALKLALEALEKKAGSWGVGQEALNKAAIAAIKEALAQPEQEPVADVRAYAYSGVAKNGEFFEAVLREGAKVADGDKLYTTPPKRPWVGLTDDEVFECENSVPDKVVSNRDWCLYLGKAIGAKLKEKNT